MMLSFHVLFGDCMCPPPLFIGHVPLFWGCKSALYIIDTNLLSDR